MCFKSVTSFIVISNNVKIFFAFSNVKVYEVRGTFVAIRGIENNDFKAVLNNISSHRKFNLTYIMYTVCQSSETESEKDFNFSKHDQNVLLGRYECFAGYVLDNKAE